MRRRSRTAALASCASSVLVGLAGCGTDAVLSVDLRTDLAPGVDFVGVTTELLASGATSERPVMSADAVASGMHDFFRGRRVAELAPLEHGEYELRVRLVDGRGLVVARRDVAVSLSGSLSVVVLVTRDCRGVTCPGTGDEPALSTCLGGRCVDPRCVGAADEPACGTPECRADSDCPALAACATSHCVAGVCLYEARDDRCGAGEVCAIDLGCRPLVTDSDAGLHRDAGAAIDGGMSRADAAVSTDAAIPDAGLDGGGGDAGSCTPACGVTSCGFDPVCGASCGTCEAPTACTAGTCVAPTATTLCVAGMPGPCGPNGGTWTGSLCCMPNVTACVVGTATACSDASEHWTGSLCCVENIATCVAGSGGSCGGAIEHWTGSICCVDAPAVCTTGLSGSCGGSQEFWTGTFCCVVGVSSCVPGTAGACSGAGRYWTGSMCCM